MKRIFPVIIITLIILFSCAKKGILTPPDAYKKSISKEIFGRKISDDYSYFKEKDSDVVLKYIEAENQYTEKMTAHTKNLQEILYHEIIGRIDENDVSVPEQIDSFLYYNKEEKGKDYPVYLRKLNREESYEETLLDMNKLGGKYDFYDIRLFELTDDNRYLAFSYDTTGSEKYRLKIYDTLLKVYLPDRVSNITSFSWLK
ncbi:MAG: hypothetical protein COS84_04165, partial [Armatimonadetes bacterium CG07_land_8_20_14_0_80_40_9]